MLTINHQALPLQLTQLEARLKEEYAITVVVAAGQAKAKAAKEREKRFHATTDLGHQLSISPELIIEKYFLDGNGLPDRSKTTEVLDIKHGEGHDLNLRVSGL